MTATTPVTQFLDAAVVPYRTFVHPGPVHSLEQAAQERGHLPEQVVRTLLFRHSSDDFFLALMAGPAQVDWKKLRAIVGRSRVTTASTEEVLAVTGYRRGAVSPLGIQRPLPVYADPSVFEPPEISIGSGVRGTTVILASADLRRLLPHVQIVALGG